MYRVCAPTVKRTEEYLRTTAELDLKDRTNLRYYIAMHAVACLVEKAEPESQEIAAIDPKALDDNRLGASTDSVKALYEALGGNDQVAKGPHLRNALRKDLEDRFPKLNKAEIV